MLAVCHLIRRIIRLNGVNLLVLQQPISLIDVLPKYWWRKGVSPSGLPILKPDIRQTNNWIKHPNAHPNQYRNPNAPEPDQIEHRSLDAPNQPQAAQCDIPPVLTQQLATIIEKMCKLNENQQTTNKKLKNLSSRFTKLTKTVTNIDEVQTELMKRCVRYFGASNASPSHTPQQVDDDDDDNIDEDDEANEDENDDVNPDGDDTAN